jgi:hypothetical protein
MRRETPDPLCDAAAAQLICAKFMLHRKKTVARASAATYLVSAA